MANVAREVLGKTLPKVTVTWSEYRSQLRCDVDASSVYDVLKCLRDQAGFDQLTDVTAVDLLELGDATERFQVVYCLLNVDAGDRVIVRTYLSEPDLTLKSATSLWSGADWLEREVYDMFGIEFEGHPNFKRLLLPQEFASFPLRKDYPQQGRGERHNFPVITRADS